MGGHGDEKLYGMVRNWVGRQDLGVGYVVGRQDLVG